MLRRTVLALFSAWTLTLAPPAFAASGPTSVNIPAGPLNAALHELVRQTGAELLFDQALVSGVQSQAVRGKLSAEAALQRLLVGSDLTVRRAASGALILERPSPAPLAQQDVAVSEILVVGRRSQNADIRRLETDVQPYRITTRKEILSADRDDLDQYFTSRMTANTQVVPAGLSQSADTLSQIDLRGLGSDNTLVLIDGRRMPGIPSSSTGFRQGDLNGVPLHAIQRIETLTGAAGGIYGFGALGGVVNVVIDRESLGFDLHVGNGITSRNDASRNVVEGRYGFTSGDGATNGMVFASHAVSASVLVGERSYEDRDQRRTAAASAPTFSSDFLHVNSASIYGSGRSLIFKPQFGGAALAANHTFLPAGFAGGAADLVAALTKQAGQLDFGLADGDARSDLGSNPRSDALFVNVRHRFNARVDAYVDALVLGSRGESNDRITEARVLMVPTSPSNPFTDLISVTFPVPDMGELTTKRIQTARYTAGLVAQLPFDWRGTAETSFGSFHSSQSVLSDFYKGSLFLFGAPSDPNPLGDWATFQKVITAQRARFSVISSRRNRFQEQSFRLAGPVFSTQQGPATLTVLAERRTEDVPAYTEVRFTDVGGVTTSRQTVASRSEATTSIYAELRARVFGNQARSPPLRGLEVQLAARRDDRVDAFSTDPLSPAALGRLRARFKATAYTAGAKSSPLPWLMLRASYATGEQPPPLDMLTEITEVNAQTTHPKDPKRGSFPLGTGPPFVFKHGGFEALKTVRATSLALGAVLTPFGAEGPRLSIDYSRLRRTRDVLSLTPDVVMANEDFWPQRVKREPLSEDDRAKGYTGGPVAVLDSRAMNAGGLEVDAFDARGEWPLTFQRGRLRFYGDATYHFNNRQTRLFQPDVQRAGYRDGPLRWRANGGADWATDRLTVGANLQYFGDYLIFQQGELSDPALIARTQPIQGSRHVPAQIYLDLHATWRLPLRDSGPLRDATLDFGLVNVLDTAPPREASMIFNGPGYSRYGDPRQRRFELVLSSHF